MKANAPEKIYLPNNPVLSISNLNKRTSEDDIEYTRTDAFIEKACKWIKESITNNPDCNRIISKRGVITMGLFIEDFKNYMKGE